jgi:uncharacterized protein (DUF58 family)
MGRLGWIAVGFLMLAAVILRNSLLFTMGMLLVLLGLTSWLWSRYCLVEVRYRRRFGSNRLFFGEETDFWIEVTNAKPLPLAWLRCEDEIPNALTISPDTRISRFNSARRMLVNLFTLRWYERVVRRYRITGSARGAWTFGPVRLISGDIFGFSIQREQIDALDRLLVYPRILPIGSFGLPAQHPFGDYRAARRIVEDPMRLMGVREYQQGDSFRAIHWKATARRRDLQTKVFEPSASRLMLIFVNVDLVRNRFEGADPELREYAISAAASIARWAWEHGETVGIYSNGLMPDGKRMRISASSRSDQILRVLEGLALLRSVTHSPFERVLQVETESLRYGTTVVVVSAVVDAALSPPLADLQRRGHAVTVVHPGAEPPAYPLPGVRLYHIGDGRTEDEPDDEQNPNGKASNASRTLELA